MLAVFTNKKFTSSRKTRFVLYKTCAELRSGISKRHLMPYIEFSRVCYLVVQQKPWIDCFCPVVWHRLNTCSSKQTKLSFSPTSAPPKAGSWTITPHTKWYIPTHLLLLKTSTFTHRDSGARVSGCEVASCRHHREPSSGSRSPAERQSGRREKPQQLRHPPCTAGQKIQSKTPTSAVNSLQWTSWCDWCKCYWIRATVWNVNGRMM